MHDITTSHLDLQATAKEIMQERGFDPDFTAACLTQVASLKNQAPVPAMNGIRDMRDLLWSSIDNDTSRDLDQIEVAESQAGGATKIMVGIADVDVFAPKA